MLIESLSVMYPQQSRTDADDRIRARTWISDLAEYPADLIDAACAQWRRKDTAFMPSPGQLIALIEPTLKHRQRLKRRADLVFEAKAETRPARPHTVAHEPDPRVAAEMDSLVESLRNRPNGGAA